MPPSSGSSSGKLQSLKERPKEDRAALAASAAVGLVIILVIGWGYFFLKKIARGNVPSVSAPVGANDAFDFSSLDQATKDFANSYNDTKSQFQQIRDAAADAQAGSSVQYDAGGVKQTQSSPFDPTAQPSQ